MSAMPAILDHREFADIDRHFANFVADFGGEELPAIAAAALSRNVRLGHICLDLVNGPARFSEPPPGFQWPVLEIWQNAFEKNRAIGGPDAARPLVIDNAGLLYLRRYWDYEQSLAAAILRRCDANAPVGTGTDDLRQLAISTALARRFVVISGGPGTGKTTTVLKILERMVNESAGKRLRIALAAPTGKAAARLQETLGAGAGEVTTRERLPKSASTLHRLLGARHGSVYFRHNARNLLPVDVVVVDEASMVALPLMAKLFDALPERARVILLGDRHQLASVEPGAVLGNIADAASEPGSPLHGSLVTLKKNYRFGNESGIFALCEAVREGNPDWAVEILRAGNFPDLVAASTPSPSQLEERLRSRVIAGYSDCLKAGDPAVALREFQKFRVLCALRAGPTGVENLNRRIEAVLRAEGLVSGTREARHGLPILITRNDHPLRLYNGDTGIFLVDPTDGSSMAWFTGEDGGLRRIAPARLPEHEPAFAMTIHKSQGSEFYNVLLVLPDRESPVLARELVYTGLTRARHGIEIWFQEPVLRASIVRRLQRGSGLRDRFRGEADPTL